MSALCLTLREAPAQRLDLSMLLPERLAALSPAEIERLPVQTTRRAMRLGDVFRLRPGDAKEVVIEGGSARFDCVGACMSGGVLRVIGAVGQRAGCEMLGGHLLIEGDAGPFAAAGLRDGVVEIAGDAGDYLGGTLPGERTGMAGGSVRVRGSAGARAGDRLRRGLIIVEGDAGADPGSRMLAGTLMICGSASGLAGYLMRRGTLVIGQFAKPGETFQPCGLDPVFPRLLRRLIAPYSADAAAMLDAPLSRFMGDLAGLGKGEMLIAQS